MEYKPSFADQLNTDYICHHGIKGQKWGVRRYQNEDGSLTAAGKKHYDTNDSNVNSSEKVDKYVKAGATLAVGAMAVYGGVKLNKALNENPQMVADAYDNLSEGAKKNSETFDMFGTRGLSDVSRTQSQRFKKAGDIWRAKAAGDKESVKKARKEYAKEIGKSMLFSDAERGAYARYREKGNSKPVAMGKTILRHHWADIADIAIKVATNA